MPYTIRHIVYDVNEYLDLLGAFHGGLCGSLFRPALTARRTSEGELGPGGLDPDLPGAVILGCGDEGSHSGLW